MRAIILMVFIALVTLAASAQTASTVGQEVPDFILTDQDGKSVHLKDFRGKVVMVTFLYTRCPFPDKCPMIADKLGKTRALIDGIEGAREKFQVLSITIDPEYDTPERLKAYTQGNDKAFPNWAFLTGKPTDVAKVAALFGVVYWEEQGVIEHNLRTALIDQHGKLARVFPGSDWKAGEMAATVKALLPK